MRALLRRYTLPANCTPRQADTAVSTSTPVMPAAAALLISGSARTPVNAAVFNTDNQDFQVQ